ncbi:Uncharacterised protein [Mycobacteroides abscessus subsp. abscessus]|nr:Uncharacterised protein [Mycobacteroides abscessus subsp. abscessus]
MNSSARAARAAASTSASVASRRPYRMFSRTVAAKRTDSWRRTETLPRREARVTLPVS